MATIAPYPDGIGTPGPTIKTLISHPVEYEVAVHRNEDGGADINVQPCGPRRWELEYDGLLRADLELIRTHYNLAKAEQNDFSFYSRYDAQTYTGVMYESVEVPRHRKQWFRALRVILVKFG